LDVPEGKAKQDIVADLARRMIARAGRRIPVQTTLDRDEALSGADFVCAQYRVGGLRARARDESIPLAHGYIGQETVGAGGFMKAFRTVPVAIDLGRAIERLCPQAWILNFTNPSGLITEALLNHAWPRTVGLCNAPRVMERTIAARLGVSAEAVRLSMVGLNHLSFVTAIDYQGKDILETVMAAFVAGGQWPDGPAMTDFDREFLSSLGLLPNGYLRYYWIPERMLAEEQHRVEQGYGTRADEVMRIEQELFRRYRDPSLAEKPPELALRGGAFYSEVAVEVLQAIALDQPREMVVNVKNDGAVRELPGDASVEVSSVVDGRGAHPKPQQVLPLAVNGLVQQVKAYEELTIEAAIRQDRGLALQALALNPLVGSVDGAAAILNDAWPV
ncbi:MAG: 6-phospho-beta-glucosidase, partial [Clostridia bacterium]